MGIKLDHRSMEEVKIFFYLPCYSLKVCVPQVYVEIVTPNVIVSGSEAFGRR